ncbi:tRNA1(Val) (adenine(37)-N6)-methyltransferase [Lentilactobacillus diolivorans]|uniref:Methyltransferase small n=2 Tax=Lentilactobacillus diolivorans TaxID=179838 RepID=A0A0R1SIA8_9LACO|nr:tRNA1(Val) (adenine(37)-N6)-methyltransferase [Lentilactobacillus diolivorans]KRL68929.1 methyltransferase small [Lentilactobacillus diolivorans DSM 14421]GEP22625.1 methyltransferase [Lentilactobacillus diolivorans]
MQVKLNSDERIDQLYSKNISIIQSSHVFSFSLDAVLLADFVRINGHKTRQVVDLCAGNGAIGLFLSEKTAAHITMIEIQPKLADMATRSIKLNDLGSQISVVNDDLKNATAYLKKDSVDIVACNPPYFVNYETSVKNPNQYVAIARHEIKTNLNEIVKVSADLLKMNAKLFMVYRPDRLTDLMVSLRKNRLEPKKLRFVRPRIGMEANMVLIEAIKDGKPDGLKVLADLITYDGDHYTDEVKKMLYGQDK